MLMRGGSDKGIPNPRIYNPRKTTGIGTCRRHSKVQTAAAHRLHVYAVLDPNIGQDRFLI